MVVAESSVRCFGKVGTLLTSLRVSSADGEVLRDSQRHQLLRQINRESQLPGARCVYSASLWRERDREREREREREG